MESNDSKPIPVDRNGKELSKFKQWTQAHPLLTIGCVLMSPFVVGGIDILVNRITNAPNIAYVEQVSPTTETNSKTITSDNNNALNAMAATITDNALADVELMKTPGYTLCAAHSRIVETAVNLKGQFTEDRAEKLADGAIRSDINLYRFMVTSIRNAYATDREAHIIAESIKIGRWSLVCAKYVNTGHL